nr:MAG TPA: hypothetical protein [Caudoviricetes sp.]
MQFLLFPLFLPLFHKIRANIIVCPLSSQHLCR